MTYQCINKMILWTLWRGGWSASDGLSYLDHFKNLCLFTYILITNRTSHKGFRLVTLNDPERQVEYRAIMSAEYRLPLLAKTDPRSSRTVSPR